MRINIITTYNDEPQHAEMPQAIEDDFFYNLPTTRKEFVEKHINNFIDKDVVKISMCITELDDDEFVPGWFLNSNGKFYFKNRVLQ